MWNGSGSSQLTFTACLSGILVPISQLEFLKTIFILEKGRGQEDECHQLVPQASGHFTHGEMGWKPHTGHRIRLSAEGRIGAALMLLVLKTLESPLDCKEIKPVNPKGNPS